MTGTPSRRHLFRAGAGLLAAASLTGCDLSTSPSNGRRGRGGGDVDAKEAPSLAERVRAKDLPPLAERLPAAPLVVEPVDEAGTYGGNWSTVLLGPADLPWLDKTVHYECLMRWKPDFSAPVPNIAESVEVGGDGRTYTFRLRPGMRWSDGQPFTSADVIFAVHDVLLNQTLTPVPPTWLLAAGEKPRVEAPDDRTVRFEWTEPSGLFLDTLASLVGRPLTAHPRHYLAEFHGDHNSDVAALVESSDFDDWAGLFTARSAAAQNPDLPVVFPWLLTKAVGETPRLVAERNPYYWKTDPDGRQLPYIDTVSFDVVEEEQVVLLKATNGELGFHARHVNTLRNKPVLAANRDTGGYDFFELVPSVMNDLLVQLNLAHADPVMRRMFQNKDFRIGLSHAINRPELIDTVVQGQGEPWQAAPRRESEFFDEELAKQYTEFDLDLANTHLDRAGFAERDADGFRLHPDGERIRFNVEVATPTVKDFWVDAMDLIKGYWAEVGVDIRVVAEDRSLFYERKEANAHDAVVWQGPGGLADAVADPRCYFPFSAESGYATPWAAWFASHGSAGSEPPPAAREQMELYRRLEGTVDERKQGQLFRSILDIAKEEFWVIGTILPTQGYGIVADDFHNVPRSMPDANVYATPGPTNPEQYFVSSE